MGNKLIKKKTERNIDVVKKNIRISDTKINSKYKSSFVSEQVDNPVIYPKNNKHLICDDAFTNRLVLKKYLVLFGCDVDEAENGADAIEKIKLNGEYSIIWMDIKMPKIDGHECTKILRNEMDYKGKIIGLTGYVDDITIKKCYSIGMNNVIAKPFDSEIIEMYVDKNSR